LRGFFFRNAINLGVVLVEYPEAGVICHLDRLEVDDDEIRCPDTGGPASTRFPPFIRDILADGGIIAHFHRKDNCRQ
jgi:3-isopropylmalate dehydratase small subunit